MLSLGLRDPKAWKRAANHATASGMTTTDHAAGANNRQRTDKSVRIDAWIGRILLLQIVALIVGLLIAPREAEAHEVTRADCRAYARLHAFATGSPGAGTAMGRACRIRAAAHRLTHGLTLPNTLDVIRACESGKRAGGRGIAGTFDYTAKNPISTASGAYQYLDTTWGGHEGYRRAYLAPRRVQDARALRDYRNGDHHTLWAASRGCW
jgi:hypothetical protein